jgi:hypothetical protein
MFLSVSRFRGRVGNGRVFSIRSGPVEIRPVHFWRQTGKNPAKKSTKIRQKSGKDPAKNRQKSGFVQPDELAKIRFRPAG